MNHRFIIKGNICQTINPKQLDLHENAFAVCVDGIQKVYLILCPKRIAPCLFMTMVMR